MSLLIRRAVLLALTTGLPLAACTGKATADGDDTAASAEDEGTGTGGDATADEDGDGWTADEDCNDQEPAIHPGATEVCGDGVDNDCNGLRSCIDETWTVSGETTAHAHRTWMLAARAWGGRPGEGRSALIEGDWRCVADDTVAETCEDGEVEYRELEWTDGHLEHGDGDTSAWDGRVYQLVRAGQTEHEGVTYDTRTVIDFATDDIEQPDTAGRPFTVGRSPRIATASAAPGWCDPVEATTDAGEAVQAHWLRAARAEHASVASFARFALELMALGAPSDLVDEAAVAMRDEVRHARLCFGVAAAAGATDVGVGPLDMQGALPDVTPVTVLQALILEGCINETISAALAERALATATEPRVRDALEQIVADETRHAAYAWRCARWLLTRHPHLRPIADKTFRFALATAGQGGPDRTTDAVPAWGLLGADDRLRTRTRAWRAVIQPATDALLASAPEVVVAEA